MCFLFAFFKNTKQKHATANQHRFYFLFFSFPMAALCEGVRRETSPTGLLSGVSLHCLSSFTDYTCVLPVTRDDTKAARSFL